MPESIIATSNTGSTEAPTATCAFVPAGVRLETDALGVHARADLSGLEHAHSGALALLPHWGQIEAVGPQADAFLQGQLSNDVAAIAPGNVGLGGYCTPKGRMLATFWILHAGEEYRLFTSREITASVAKRISMFVLRSRVRIADRSSDCCVVGLYGKQVPAALAGLGLDPVGARAASMYQGLYVAGLDAVDGIERWLLSMPVERAAQVWDALAGSLSVVSSDLDRWLEVRSGVPRITSATQELFVPQMINFELLDGVGFKKGCYPGQEVVARTQYLGKLKRRLFAAAIAPEPARSLAPQACVPGAPVSVAGLAEPVGTVVLAAPSPDGGLALLIEYRVQAAAGSVLLVAGVPLEPGALPYEVPAL